ISAPAGKLTLLVSSVGYSNREISVGADQNNVSITLSPGNQQLNEVVVTALGITRQSKTLVYAAQTVKPAQLTEVRDANNVLNSFQGKVANATITQGSGGPGSGARIVLRGNRSLQGSNNALIVVDGVPITNNTNGAAGSDFGSVQGSDGASNINPDDIESVTVLRGASAAALYGSAAGNGVIVITTKKGGRDRVSVNVNSGVALEQANALPKVQNSYGQGNGGELAVSTGESWGAKMTGQSYTDAWGNQASYSAQPNNIKDFFRTGTSFNNSIGVSGGNDKMQTYLSYTNNSIQGIIPRNNLLRHTINLRVTNQISKRFSTDGKITYIAQQVSNRPRTGEENAPTIDIYQISRNIPTASAKNYETTNNLGIPTPTTWPSTLSSIYQSPYWMVNRTSIMENRDRIMGFLSAKFKITDWLAISGRANMDKIIDQGSAAYSAGTVLWSTNTGSFYTNNIRTTQKWLDVMLEGNNKITDNLKVDYRVGAIYQDNLYLGSDQSAKNLNITNKFSINYASEVGATATTSQTQTQSVFGQLNFSFKDAIFVDASIRNDWSSTLPSPYGFIYPSVGASAILSDLMTMPKAISFLKLNASYAQVGNGGRAQIRNATYGYSAGAGNGFLSRSSTLPLPGLKPEIVTSLEFGVEARFIDNRIGFTATYYKSNSKNQLLLLSLPVATGYSNQYVNAGNIENRGFEFVLNGTPVRNRDFSWDVTFNLGINRNKIKALLDEVPVFYLGGGYGRSATPIAQVGGSYGDMVSYLWETNAKGQRVVKADGTPAITAERGLLGNFNPRATLGLSNSFTFKQFFARVLIDGRSGGVMISGTEMNLAFSGIPEITEKYREGGLVLGGVDANGSPVTTAITSQQFWQTASGKRYGNGEFFAYDATNFRLRELTLGYSIPVKENFVVKAAKISIVGRNLFWLYKGSSKLDIPGIGKRKMWFDPDMSLGNGNFQGVEYGTLPSTRTLGLNLQLTF
ncbi:MAG TPA: SusC/RagA family TonB-linked outer membrane protein, partial [Flavihumibacter sp.]|nr:SusC/RagA family TonB-linked outer membrane protein [Flavihumibacter sp.]